MLSPKFSASVLLCHVLNADKQKDITFQAHKFRTILLSGFLICAPMTLLDIALLFDHSYRRESTGLATEALSDW
jgi:hypothetical protein